MACPSQIWQKWPFSRIPAQPALSQGRQGCSSQVSRVARSPARLLRLPRPARQVPILTPSSARGPRQYPYPDVPSSQMCQIPHIQALQTRIMPPIPHIQALQLRIICLLCPIQALPNSNYVSYTTYTSASSSKVSANMSHITSHTIKSIPTMSYIMC